ncbi:hypothetical protein Tco_0842696 [Tanacetum coccineum]|uniref:Uncharacterized protein n=1 Tax=Tanacetum coccineum TaxID=301880 RepID=A0ABQ5B4B9_9ASTR
MRTIFSAHTLGDRVWPASTVSGQMANPLAVIAPSVGMACVLPLIPAVVWIVVVLQWNSTMYEHRPSCRVVSAFARICAGLGPETMLCIAIPNSYLLLFSHCLAAILGQLRHDVDPRPCQGPGLGVNSLLHPLEYLLAASGWCKLWDRSGGRLRGDKKNGGAWIGGSVDGTTPLITHSMEVLMGSGYITLENVVPDQQLSVANLLVKDPSDGLLQDVLRVNRSIMVTAEISCMSTVPARK